MGVFDRQIASAKRLIAKNGQFVTWRSIGEPTPVDPNKPWDETTHTQTDSSVKIAFLPTDRIGAEFRNYLAGTSVPMGKELGYMAPVDFTPSLKDVVLRGSEELSILKIDRIAPNGEIVLYIIEFAE